jgi:hypothetical protein
MKNSVTYPLRLPYSLKQALKETVEDDGGSMNQFIIVAIAEKLSAMKTMAFFDKARQEANLDTFWQILNRKGGEPPREHDEL